MMYNEDGDTMNLLIIEDDETIRIGLKYYLEQEGFTVLTSENVAQSLQIYQNNSIDLVLLDINLPDGNGYDLFKELKNIKDVPIIFLTANDLEVSIVRGLDMGADDYIVKPFKMRELISRIRNVLRRVGKQYNSQLQFKDIVIDLKQAKVLKNGKDVFLTALEYKIFLILALNPGQIFTREKILSDIWDVNEEFVNDNTLTVYIKRIREKIEDNPNNPEIILTVRGIGYKVDNNVAK